MWLSKKRTPSEISDLTFYIHISFEVCMAKATKQPNYFSEHFLEVPLDLRKFASSSVSTVLDLLESHFQTPTCDCQVSLVPKFQSHFTSVSLQTFLES